MGRAIKFRGKRTDNGVWIYGMPTSDFMYLFNGEQLDSVDNYRIDTETIGQFTGLKDKNGVEIYEGDIVIEESYPMYNCGLCNYRCVVIWNEEEAGFGLEMYVVSNRVRGCAVPDSISEYTEIEVIGNIYDNPEMLEL